AKGPSHRGFLSNSRCEGLLRSRVLETKSATMAEAPEQEQDQATLSSRIEAYRREIQALVAHGAEHPRFEFKRCCSLSRENLDDRLDFIKLLQGIANSDADGDCCIVIGVDQKTKQF